MNFRKIIKTLTISVLFAVSATPVMGQDLLARQAPVDRKMKTVDTIMLRNIIVREEAESPAGELYANWDNKYAHRATELPEKFKIDLRHFCMPTTSRVITSNFGSRWGRQHKGIDVKVYIGDTIRAAFSGKVRIVRYEGGGYGKYIVIRHNNGLETIYGHLSKQLVSENQEVRVGEPIGLGGNTGRSTGSHLHFETRYYGQSFDPERLIDFKNGLLCRETFLLKKSFFSIYSNAGQDFDDEIANEEQDKKEAAEKAAMKYHRIKSGDTLGAIARKYGTTVTNICRLNGIKSTTTLRIGRSLRVR